MIATRAVILAAGTSSRIGRQKLLMDFRGRKLIEYSIAAAQVWSPIVVAGPEVRRYLAGRPDVTVLLNDAPERGMSHSLALANQVVAPDQTLLVFLGDKPLIGRSLIESVCKEAQDADIVFPTHEGAPGHPVRISPRARRYIDELPPGDTVRMLRNRVELRYCAIQTEDRGAVFDVDELSAF
jgi:molybdenum cofactor cytidylyltransferase